MVLKGSRQTIKLNSNRLRNSLLALAVLSLILIGILAYRTYRVYQSGLPSFEQLHNIEPSLSTRIYDRNGILIKEFFTENRALTPFRDFPEHLVDMLLASEDHEFYDHWGISLRRIAIVAVSNFLKGQITAGASTVTQQTARMLFLDRQMTYERKIKEALTAIKLERTYSKDEIIEFYLNQHYFGRGAYGVAAAARLYFDKRVPELNVSDCAILIGMLKGPNINSPLNNPDKAFQARNRVLHSYFMLDHIGREAFDSLQAYGVSPQCILTMPILVGLDGEKRMSKSLGNYIGIDEPPREIFGKVMSIPDDLIYQYYELATDISLEELREVKQKLSDSNINPMSVKKDLGITLVDMYHPEGSGVQARTEFERMFSQKGLPDDMPVVGAEQLSEFGLEINSIYLVHLISKAKLARSNSEARKLIEAGSVSLNDQKVTDSNFEFALTDEAILKVGKRRFLRLVPQ